MSRMWNVVPLVAVSLWLGMSPVAAQTKRQDLKATAEEIVKEVKTLAASQGQMSIRLGEFNVSGLDGDGRAALEHELQRAFGSFLNPKSVLELNGRIRYVHEDGVEGKVIKIEANVENRGNGKVVKTVVPPILYVHDIARFVGPNGVLPPKGSSGEARKELEKLVEKPTVAVAQNGQVTPVKNSPYTVEIRVKKDGSKAAAVAQRAILRDGLPFVQINPGEVYEVHVQNHSQQEAALRLSIDGLDVFSFTQDRKPNGPSPTHFIVSPAKNGVPGEAVVYGWHKKFNDIEGKLIYDEFLVTEYGKSGILGKPKSKIGMIELAFSHSYTVDEKAKARGDAETRGGAETGKGREGQVPGSVVKRVIDPPTEFLTIRYDRVVE